MRRESRGSNKNAVPSAAERRALKTWMLAEFGDGISCLCAFECGTVLLYSTITKDRFPIPGRHGGRYIKGNIRPACGPCNYSEGAREAAQERAEARQKREGRLARRRERYARQKVAEALA